MDVSTGQQQRWLVIDPNLKYDPYLREAGGIFTRYCPNLAHSAIQIGSQDRLQLPR